MKLGSLNTDKVIDKYSIAKAGTEGENCLSSIAKDMATGDPNKTKLGVRSGNQNTHVPKKAQKLMGTQDSGGREVGLTNKVESKPV